MRHEATRHGIWGWLLAATLAGGAPLHADAALVADVNTAGTTAAGFWSLDDEAAVLDDRLYVFVADDAVTGREPWVLDLWTGAAERLADIHPGPTASHPRDFVVIGSSLLFVATDPTHGEELWTTDGTPAGTALVLDIFPGATGSAIAEVYPVPGDRAVFRADDGVAGSELWVSDGTSGGTGLVADIQTGAAGSSPGVFAFTAGTLFFRANDGVDGAELWKWASGSASLVADIEPGAGGSTPSFLYPVGGHVVFRACLAGDCELWRSDGTGAGTVLVDDLNPTGSSYPHGFFHHPGLGRLFFNADDGVHGNELWQLSGGVATRLTDLSAGTGDSDPTALGALASELVFVADDGGAGSRLFSYDGVGVTQVKSLSTAGVPGAAEQALSWNGRVYFVEGFSSCWSTDGTSAGTVEWASSLGAPALTLGDGRLLYGDSESGEREIWSIDAADVLAQETDFASFSSDPESVAWLGTMAFFSADDGVEGRELWVSDGTPGGTHRIDLEAGPEGSDPEELQPFDGEMWFLAGSATTGQEPWHSDGTAVGTTPYELSAGSDSSSPSELAVVGDHLFVAAYHDTLGAQLFRIAGAASPPEVLEFAGDPDLYPEDLTPVGNRLFFFAENPATGIELFVVEETAAQPTPLEVVAGPDDPSSLDELVGWNGAAWFVADDGIHGTQIWTSDGTTVTRVTSLSGSAPSQLAAGPGGVYFVFDEPLFGSELWRVDGTTTARVTDIAPGGDDAYPGDLTLVGDRLYFTANDGTTGDELWWTDGATVAQVADLRSGESSSYPNELVAAGDRLVFAADDGTGEELWLADASGVHRLPEAWPGTGSSGPSEVAVHPAGSQVLFSAVGPTTWREPYRVELLPFADGFESGDDRFWNVPAP